MVSQVDIQFSHRYVDVIWINTELWAGALRRLFQSLAVRTFQRNSFEQNHHHQIESPDLVGLTKRVDTSHLSLLVRVGKDALGRGQAAGLYALYETVAAFVMDVFAQLGQQSHRPLLTNVDSLSLKTQQR